MDGDTRLSFGDVADRYIRDYVPYINGERGKPRREGGRKLMEWMVKALKRVEIPARGGRMMTLADKPFADITTADVEAVRVHWPLKKKQPKGGVTGPCAEAFAPYVQLGHSRRHHRVVAVPEGASQRDHVRQGRRPRVTARRR